MALIRVGRPAACAGPSDVLFMAYVAVTGMIVLVAGWVLGSPAIWLGLVTLHIGLLAVAAVWSAGPTESGSIRGLLRDIYPLLFVGALYVELRYLALLFSDGFHDPAVLGWEEWLFGEQVALTLSQRVPEMWLSELLHFCYAFYWPLLPLSAVVLYLRRRAEGLQELVWSLLVTFFSCYLIFIFWPVQGPHYEFPPIGPPLADGFWYGVVHAVLEDGGSRGAAFPSSHVAVAVTILLVAWRHDRGVFWALLAPVTGLGVGTVYGRFHYGVDALAGVALALALFPPGLWLRSWIQRRLRTEPSHRSGGG
jgi:hypothetical protein